MHQPFSDLKALSLGRLDVVYIILSHEDWFYSYYPLKMTYGRMNVEKNQISL
jgi:hypothetical protein